MQSENASFALLVIFVFPRQPCLWLVQLDIFHPPVPPIALLAASVRIRMCPVLLALFAHLDTSVRLPVKFSLAAEAVGALQANWPAMFVVLDFIVHFQPILIKFRAPLANILLLHRLRAPFVLLAVFALYLEANDFLAHREVFHPVVQPIVPYVPLESTPRHPPRLAGLALRVMLVFLRPQAHCSAFRVSTVWPGRRHATRVLQAARALKPRQIPFLAPPDNIHWATAPPALIVLLAITVPQLLLLL